MKVGFIGLGRMGRGMARRILDGGHDLAVYDVVRGAGRRARRRRRAAATSLADVCDGRDVVVTMLVEDATVLDVALRPGGLRDSLPQGAIHLAMGTYGVATIRTLAAAHAAARPDAGGGAGPRPARPRRVRAAGHRHRRTGRTRCARCDAAARGDRQADLPRRRRSRKRPRRSSWPTTSCSAARWWRWPKASRWSGSTASSRRCFYDVMTEGLFSAPAYKGYGQTMVDESYDQVGLADHRRPEGRQPDCGRRRSRARADAEPSTSIAIACSAPSRTATATATRPSSRASRRAPAASIDASVESGFSRTV